MNQKFANAFECYEAIGSWLSDEVPEPWERIVVNFKIIEIDDVSERSIVYVPKNNLRAEKGFAIRDTNFTDCFFQLAHLTSAPEKGLFKKCKFTLYDDGRYATEFEY